MPPQPAQERLRWAEEELETVTRAWMAACNEQGELMDALMELLSQSPNGPPSQEEIEMVAKFKEICEERRFQAERLRAMTIFVKVATWEASRGESCCDHSAHSIWFLHFLCIHCTEYAWNLLVGFAKRFKVAVMSLPRWIGL